jgi:hypothetical protein
LMKRYEAPQRAASERNMTQERRDIRVRGCQRSPISPNEDPLGGR